MVMEILDDPQVMRIHRMSIVATGNRPMPRLLRELCGYAAEILPADVVSIYVRENDDEGDVLVMRANVGFPDLAIGNVAMALGEGITGVAAQHLRPVLREHAETDKHFRPFEGLGEEEYPLFLAWPLARENRVLGVVVFQRRPGKSFSQQDVAMAGALSSNFLLALEEMDRRQHEATATRISEVGHEARLTGVGVAAGVQNGRAEPLPTIQQLLSDTDAQIIEEGLERARRQFDKDLSKLALPEPMEKELRQLRLVLEDERFWSQLKEEVGRRGLAAGIAALSRRYALSATKSREGDWLAKRAAEVSALCRSLAAQLAGRPLARQGAVLLLAERPGSFIAVEAVVRRVSAIAVADAMDPDGLPARILQHGRVATVADVAGLFDWARPGDPMVVDADQGLVWVNPSQSRVAKSKSYMPPGL